MPNNNCSTPLNPFLIEEKNHFEFVEPDQDGQNSSNIIERWLGD